MISMDLQEFINKMKNIQQNLLDFLEENQEEEKYQNLIKSLKDQQITTSKYDLKTFLYILVKISNNHYRYPHFFDKIEKILLDLKKAIKDNYSNSEIFNIFKNNKRLLHFLLEENILIFDEFLSKIFMRPKYQSREYFNYLFYQNCVKFGLISKIDENYNEKVKIGENDNLICQLIRKDLIEDFIIYVNKNDYSLNSKIIQSMYETNLTLLKNKNISLIEYATFFGSVSIFKYLYKNNVELTSSLWIYAIHGNDPEIIAILEENIVQAPLSFQKCIKESIKCHHNNTMNYIQSNHEDDFNESFEDNIISYCFHYHNFLILPDKIDNKYLLYYACLYDYFAIVEYIFNTHYVDLSIEVISILFFFLWDL